MSKETSSSDSSTKPVSLNAATFEALLEVLPDAAIVVDENGLILLVNSRTELLFDSPRSKLIGLSVEVLFPETSFRMQLHKLREGKFISTIGLPGGTPEFIGISRSGRKIPIEATLSLVGLDGTMAVLCAIRDLTKRKRVEQAKEVAEQQRRLFEAAVRNADDAVLITDGNLNAPGPLVLFVNQAHTLMTGYEAAEMIGQSPRMLQGPETDRGVLDRLRTTLLAGQKFRGEMINYRKDGTPFWLQLSVSPIFDKSGQCTHYVAVQRDATATRERERQVEESWRFLRAIIDALSSHVAVLAPSGEILAVNSSWREFARQNGAENVEFVGKNYFMGSSPCEASEHYAMVVKGIRAVISGASEEYYYEYPCHSPAVERWFGMRVSPFDESAPRRVVVAHTNITARKTAELKLHMRLRWERLLAETSTRFIDVPMESGHLAIEESLRSLAITLSADRAYALVFEDDLSTLRDIHAHSLAGLPKELAFPIELWRASIRGEPEAMKDCNKRIAEMLHQFKLQNGEPVIFGPVSELPQDHVQREYLESRKVLAILCVPILRNQRMIGMLGVDRVQENRPFEKGAELLVQTVAETLANALSRWRAEGLFRSIVDGISASTGERFLPSLTEHICSGLEVDFAFVAELLNDQRCKVLAFHGPKGQIKSFEYDIGGTPCHDVIVNGEFCIYSQNVGAAFPTDYELHAHSIAGFAGMPLWDAHGKVMGVICVMHRRPLGNAKPILDVLRAFAARAASEIERRRQEDEVRAWNLTLEHRVAERAAVAARQAAAMDATSEGMAILEGGMYVYMNDAHAQMFGYESGRSLLGHTWKELFGPAEIERLETEGREGLVREGKYAVEFLGKHHNGSSFDVSLSLTLTERGDLICCCRDITERKHIERELLVRGSELSQVNLDLAHASRMKDEFLASMSHELRTPLNAILGMSEVLHDEMVGPLNDKQMSCVKIVDESGRHLLSLINDILDLSKIEAGTLGLEMSWVDVQTVAEGAMRLVRPAAQAKGLSLTLQVDASVTRIDADQRRLKQMLVNLLDNAVKFTPHNGQIGLEIRRDDALEVVMFTVWDTGLGIAKSDTELLFRPFFQLEQGLKKQFGGAGLGLSLVKRLAEMHGGTATVESTQGKGSRFSVSIPDARSPNKAPSSRPMPLSVRRFTPRRISESAPLMMGPPVLVVDDNEINANMLRDVLSLNRFRVLVARSGREALELLATDSISAVLMDVQMPDMDGLEAIQIIRSDERFAKLPVVAITALAMTGDRERCLEAGANEYIAKPVSLKHVVTMLHRLIQS